MSTVSDLGLDLENLFQPAWAQGKPEANRFEKFTGDEGVKPERRRGERRGPRREGPGGLGPSGERRGPRPPRPGGRFGDRKKGTFRRDDRHEREDREPPAPLPEIGVAFLPDDKGVESIARQIKMTGRAYPLFDIARLILQKPERYAVRLDVKKAVAPASPPVRSEEASGQDAHVPSAVAQPLFVCALDDTPWLSEDEVVAHVLQKHFATFYQTERTPTEPPKGKYTFVAQCGMSGVILGPPNYHDYQNQLRKLHAERFARMPFDVFKSRVKIVKDEAVVKKWIEDQSFKTEFTCLNVPEPLKLPNMEEVEKHFRATHREAIVKSVEKHIVDGVKSRNLRCNGLYRLIRAEWERQRRFPLQLSTELSRQFAGQGLQFFKVNKTVVHVSVARPQFLDLETTPVSDGIKRIVNFINSTPKCTRKKLLEALAPTPAVAQASAPVRAEETHGQDAPATVAPAAPAAEARNDSTPTPTEPAAVPVAEPTPEQTLVLVDLHWLIHAGAVLEFADGRMETAKKPLPRPPKPETKRAEEKPAGEGEASPVPDPAPQAEAVVAPAAEGETAPATETPPPAKTAAEPQPPAESAPEIQAPAETAPPNPTEAPAAPAEPVETKSAPDAAGSSAAEPAEAVSPPVPPQDSEPAA